jgi:hypothetical protein
VTVRGGSSWLLPLNASQPFALCTLDRLLDPGLSKGWWLVEIAGIALRARHSCAAAGASMFAVPRRAGMALVYPTGVLAEHAFHGFGPGRPASEAALRPKWRSAQMRCQCRQLGGAKSSARYLSNCVSKTLNKVLYPTIFFHQFFRYHFGYFVARKRNRWRRFNLLRGNHHVRSPFLRERFNGSILIYGAVL